MLMNKAQKNTPARLSPGSTRTAPSVYHQERGDKYVIGEHSKHLKIRGRDSITFVTWNVRTLAQTGKLRELTHELENYNWHVVGLIEVRWKNFGEHFTDDGHVLYYSGEINTHANGVSFLINNNIKNSVLECCSVSSRLITIRLRASPFNITVIQVYAPTSEHKDEEVERFYTQLQGIIHKTNKKDILIIQGD